MVRQRGGVRVLLLEEGEEREELEEGAWPAVVEDDRRGVRRGAKERNEVDCEGPPIKRVLDWKRIVRERVDVFFVCTPVYAMSSMVHPWP